MNQQEPAEQSLSFAAVLRGLPGDLGRLGWLSALEPQYRQKLDETDLPAIEFCRKWLQQNAVLYHKVNRKFDSYGLKHMAEEARKDYVPMGCLVAAAIGLGYHYEKFGTSACFNLRIDPAPFHVVAEPGANEVPRGAHSRTANAHPWRRVR